MISTELDFGDLGTAFSIKWENGVIGETAERQRCVLNMETTKGTDFAVPEKGTTLLQRATTGLIYDATTAQHYCNFAAVDTLFFTASTGYGDIPEIAEIVMTPVSGKNARLAVDMTVTFKA